MVGHGTNPFNQISFQQSTHGNHHQAHGAITANPILTTRSQCTINHGSIDWIQNEDRIIIHAQCTRSINPMTLPTRCSQRWKDSLGIVPALAGQNNVTTGKRFNVVGVLQLRFTFGDVATIDRRHIAAGIAGTKKYRLD